MTQISTDFAADLSVDAATQFRRVTFVCALQTFRLGAFSEARKLCLALAEKSIADADFQNLYASQRILAMLTCTASDTEPQPAIASSFAVSNTDPSASAMQQRNMLEATSLYQLGKATEAAKTMRSVCLDLGDWRSVDEYTASAFVEFATMAREVMLETPRGQETTYSEYERLYRWALRNAKRVAQKFEQEKPHTYREEAWESALFGGGGNAAGLTLRNLMSSLLRARALGYVPEEIATFAAWDSMCRNYELGVLEMPQSERVRFDELICQQQALPQFKSIAVTTTTLESENGAEDLETTFEDVLTDLSNALNLDFQRDESDLEIAK